MTNRAPGPIALVVVVVVTAALVGCNATTVDETAATPSSTAITTPYAPAGTTTELFDQLATETELLSDRLVDNEGSADALVRIETLWSLIDPAVDAERPELRGGFDTVLELVRRSVERRRPADADKAHKNLLTMIAAYDGEGGG